MPGSGGLRKQAELGPTGQQGEVDEEAGSQGCRQGDNTVPGIGQHTGNRGKEKSDFEYMTLLTQDRESLWMYKTSHFKRAFLYTFLCVSV